ncbi:MAG: hypothetical protein DWQ04_03550 [Chloroflexi bacterium]|nr:MAG: hypothetical protein DWQ04_03550 [Chloroflexota bacterium]
MDSVFGIGFPELFTILILAGVVMGPERIGRVARWLGKVTAQLQAISRGFVRQLTTELESIDDGGQMKETVKEIQDLQKQLAELRGEIRGQAKGFITDTKSTVNELEQSIKPPTLGKLIPDDNVSEADETSDSSNGTSTDKDESKTPQLPKLVDIPDDQEA